MKNAAFANTSILCHFLGKPYEMQQYPLIARGILTPESQDT